MDIIKIANFKFLIGSFLSLTVYHTALADLQEGQASFEFHGYFRGSLGFSESGETQSFFKAPGARAGYRLGNEPDMNLELQMNYTYLVDKTDNSTVQGVFMIDGYKTHGESGDFTVDNLAQGYLSFNNFLSSANVWLGKRYYDRKDIHISDHTWLNPGQNSQMGTGVENLKAGSGKLDIALFRYEDGFTLMSSDYLVNSTSVDLRWHGLAISNDSSATIWFAAASRHALDSLNYDDESGLGLGGWIDSVSGKTKSTTALIYQTGASIPQGDYNGRPIREDQGWVLDDASIIEISHTRTYENLPDYSLQWTVLARQEDHGQASNSELTWISAGARPVFYLSAHRSFAFELGVDQVDDKINDINGSLSKLTAALQFAGKRGFYERPVLRIFATYASWSNDFKGLVGNTPGSAPYGNDTEGWSIGTQAEVWW